MPVVSLRVEQLSQLHIGEQSVESVGAAAFEPVGKPHRDLDTWHLFHHEGILDEDNPESSRVHHSGGGRYLGAATRRSRSVTEPDNR
jgi:hypothetical protein